MQNYVGTPLNSQKIKTINNVQLYYQFLSKNKDVAIVEDPLQWNMKDFKE